MQTFLSRALASLGRNRLHAAVTLIGLTIALAAAIIVGLFVRQQYSFEQFIPGHERIYRLTGSVAQPGQAERISQVSPPILAAALRDRSGDVEGVARLAYGFPALRSTGLKEAVTELKFAWVDPDFFKVMPLPALAGDPGRAIAEPGNAVLTRSAARRYFGRDVPIGAELEWLTGPDRVVRLRVAAVLEDLPAETHFDREIFVSGRTAGSVLAHMDANPVPGRGGLVYTYVRARPGTDATTLQPDLDAIVKPLQAMAAASGTKIKLWAEPIAAIHFGPADPNLPSAKPTIARSTVLAIGAVGLLILVMAATNYVALMTARAGGRAVEVAVRKAAGASRRDLIVQFLGESFVDVLLAMVLAMALVELLLPAINAALGLSLRFELLRDPAMLPLLIGLAVVLALLAGLYPAFVLSAFHPSVALRGGTSDTGGHALVRQAMVVAQFAILVGLIIATVTISRQARLALGAGMSADRGPVVLLVVNCSSRLPQAARELPGVRAATCVDSGALAITPQGAVTVINRTGQRFTPGYVNVDPWFFSAFGFEPLAGRLFSPDNAGDVALRRIVVNETAARHFGFASPQAAIGQTVQLSLLVGPNPAATPVEIIGVVPDRPVSVLEPAGELIYAHSDRGGVLAVNSAVEDLPRVTQGLAQLWKRMLNGAPFATNSLEQFEHDRYRGIIMQGQVVTACALVALVIAAMGLFALSSFMAEQRTREIGVRKAMGADTRAIVTLLVWQFARPILIAALIALPLSYLLMNRWLAQFATRVDLPLGLGAAALAGSVTIALATVGAHIFAAARARPARSLRDE